MDLEPIIQSEVIQKVGTFDSLVNVSSFNYNV